MNTIEREFKILNKFGIHARPAALFVKTVGQFQSDVQVNKDGNLASGRSIMSLLTLEGYCGSKLKVSATGPDAEDVLNAIGDLINNKFYED
jgi:phosphocarrier protein